MYRKNATPVTDHPFVFEKAIVPWTKSKDQAKDIAANVNTSNLITKDWALAMFFYFTVQNQRENVLGFRTRVPCDS